MVKMPIRILVLAGATACGGGVDVEAPVPVTDLQPAPPPETAEAIPLGTMLTVRMDETISTDQSTVGDLFTATVADAIVAQNGQTVVPVGARVHGAITALDDSDHPADRAIIRLNFDRLEMNGRSYPLLAAVESAEVQVGDRELRATQGALAGAATGAIAGAILSGAELDDILKAAGIGAGAGTVIAVLTGGDVEARIPEGSTVTLQTTRRIELR